MAYTFNEEALGRCCEFIVERHRVYKRREAGCSPPWTEDPVLQKYRFCNVFRELDSGTRYVTEVLFPDFRSSGLSAADVVFNLCFYRAVNRIDVFEHVRETVGYLRVAGFEFDSLLACLDAWEGRGHAVFTTSHPVWSFPFHDYYYCRRRGGYVQDSVPDKLSRLCIIAERVWSRKLPRMVDGWRRCRKGIAALLIHATRRGLHFPRTMCQHIATFVRFQSRKLCVDLLDLLGDADLAYQVALDLGYWDKSLFDEDAFVAVRHEATRGVNLLLGYGGVDDMDTVPLELWDRADAKAVQLNTIYAECVSELVDELNERVNRLDPTVLAGRRLGLATVHHVMNSVPRYSHVRADELEEREIRDSDVLVRMRPQSASYTPPSAQLTDALSKRGRATTVRPRKRRRLGTRTRPIDLRVL